jgi:regulator of cell morphogenesis and NO signaling
MSQSFISEFLKNTEKHSQRTPNDMIENAALIPNAYYTLSDHFLKEEQVLYPMAEQLFSQEEKEQLKQKVLDSQKEHSPIGKSPISLKE